MHTVPPGRVSQIRRKHRESTAEAPELPESEGPPVLMQRAIPTEPAVRGSLSLFLVEAERQGLEDTPVHALETICAATRHIFPIGQVAGVDEF